MQNERVHLSITLQDGRQLGYAEYGDSQGLPVFYFTGGNSSRLEGKWFELAASQNGIRLLVPDRPGFGLSDYQSNRQLLDWPDDVAELADALSIERFSVFGLSGGGPHVLVTVSKSPERVMRAVVVSGTAPPEMPGLYNGMWLPVRLLFITAKYFPRINRFLLKQMSRFYSDYDQMINRMNQFLPAPDAELIKRNPQIMKIFAQSAQEAHRNSIDGDAWEWHLYVNPWGFGFDGIVIDILLLYGVYDRQVPPGMGRYLAERIPRARLFEVEDGGHFSTINNHIGEIFNYLKGEPIRINE
jgi:pimeloyl-ACP methyl ester carboxylesterase